MKLIKLQISFKNAHFVGLKVKILKNRNEEKKLRVYMQVLTNPLVSYILTCHPREGKSSEVLTGMYNKLNLRSVQSDCA